jgi:hypothetical protein
VPTWFSGSSGSTSGLGVSGGTGSHNHTCATSSATMYTSNIYTSTSTSSTCCTDTIWITTPAGSYYVTGVNQYELQQQLMQQQLISQYNACNNHQLNACNQQQLANHQLAQNQQEVRRYAQYARIQEEEMQAASERAEQLVKEQVEAKKRARGLLLEHLTPQQRETFEKNGWFVVEGGKSRKRFKIFGSGYAGNVHELDVHDRMVNRLCCHANASIPLEDQLLTQKVLLEWDEEHFIKTANITRVAA